jgi:hypothetical protein
MHRFGRQVAVVVTCGRDYDPFDSSAHEVSNEALFTVSVACGIYEHDS